MNKAVIYMLGPLVLLGALGTLPGPSWAQGARVRAAAGSEPTVVHHPLTREERMQDADYESHKPLMDGAGALVRGNPDAVEERARLLDARRPLTEGPFIDWARAAALGLAELDPSSQMDQERVKSWGVFFERGQVEARSRFFANQQLRAETVADNTLCAYRESQVKKEECINMARSASKIMDPALDASWPSWTAGAAVGLAAAISWPSGWEIKRADWAERGRTPFELNELVRKARTLDAWAVALGEPVVRAVVVSQDEVRAWMERTQWTPRPAKVWGSP